MKAVLALALTGGLIFACVCVSACIAPLAGAVMHKPSTGSVAETGSKQGGEHEAKALMSPSPSPSPTPGQ